MSRGTTLSTSVLAVTLLALVLPGCDGSSDAMDESEDAPRDPITVDPLPADRLVGAHYYPWYEAHQGHQNWTEDAVTHPTLGEYASAQDSVINRHIAWALDHGIQWFSMSWWGPDEATDRVIREEFLEADLGDEIQFSILYETRGRFGDGGVDMSAPDNQDRLSEDLQYLADTYFNRDNYLHIDGQPVLFIYIGNAFYGTVQETFETAFQDADVDPYLLADTPFGSPPDVYPITKVADAITTYNPYAARPDIEEVFHDQFDRGTHVLHLSSDASDLDYVPVAIPGYNDTAIPDHQREDNPVLEASPDRYRRVANQLQPHLGDSPAVLITSFNEWYENTQIEPHEEYGEQYLDLTADRLATGTAPEYQPPEGTSVTIEWGTVAEEQALNPDAPTNRKLAFSATRVELFGEDGSSVASYDIGSEDPLLVRGAYGRESNDTRTWRWFGGPQKTTHFRALGVESIAAIELRGRLLEEMDVTVRSTGQATTERIEPGQDVYRIEL